MKRSIKKISYYSLIFAICIMLTSCKIQLPNNSTDNKTDNITDTITEELPIGKQIESEYQDLVSGLSVHHTIWTFSGVVVDMSSTQYNTEFNNYNVKLILEVDGVLIGIYNGQVNGKFPTDITGLEVGTIVEVTGKIEEKYSLTSGTYYAEIEFSKPNITWEVEEESTPVAPDNPTIPTPEESLDVNFLMINDTHGAFDDSNESVSILRVASLLESLESSDGDYITIANGDILQGSYVSSTLYGLPLIESLNLMDFDAFVIGNHEFDWGLDKIEMYKDGDLSNGEADFPFLGANIYYKGTQTRPKWIDPYTIVDYYAGEELIKVGIIGIIGGTLESSILTENVADYDFDDDTYNVVRKYSKELRTDLGCDVVVVATHADDNILNTNLASFSNDTAIDAIFCAHSHKLFNYTLTRNDGYKIPVVQNNDKNNTVQNIKITVSNNKAIKATSSILYPKKYEKSEDLISLYNKFLPSIVEANRILGTTNSFLSKDILGSYAVEAMYNYDYNQDSYSNVCLSIMNTAGVRETIPSGNITVSKVFEAFTFNNEVLLVNIKGKYLKPLLSDSYLYIKGNYDFNDNEIYTIAIIDYVFSKPSYYNNYFQFAESYYDTNIVMRDLVIDYIDLKFN